jgi:hypothetical protein
MLDLVLTIAELAVFPFAMAAIGGYLAAKVLQTRWERSLFITVFAILFVFGVLVSAVRETRASRLDEKKTQTIADMYGQIQILVGTVTHPSANPEHQEISASLRALSDKLKIPAPVVAIKPPPPSPTPDQALRKMSNKELRDYTMNMANKMRDFEAEYRATEINNEMTRPRIATTDPDQQKQIWMQQLQETIIASTSHENEFKKRFWGDAYKLREELLERLKQAGITPPSLAVGPQSQAKMVLDEGRLLGPGPISNAANYLELLVRAIP